MSVFKVLTGSAELGGSLSLQKDLITRAGTDLESKLNAGGVQKVVAGGAYEGASVVVLFAIVEAEAPKKVKSSKKEK